MTLWSEFLTNNQRGVNKWKHYFPAYETHLARFVNRPIVFLEIGIGSGGSAQLFKRYLGPHAQIISIDINPACKEFEEDQIVIRIGDQADTTFLATVLDEFGRPDVIVDTSYWDDYGGGVRREGTFIELCKSLIDELNADWSRGQLQPTDFTRSTLSMHFYDSMAVFERGRHTKKSNLIIGT